MPSNTCSINRTGTTLLTSADQSLSCTVPNGSTDIVLEISHITYGYNFSVAAVLSAKFAKGACQVIQNHQWVDGIVFYSSTSPTSMEGRSGEYLDFDVTNEYGTKNIYFIPPLRVEPGQNVVIVVPPAADQ